MYTQKQAKLIECALKAQAIGDAIGEDFEFSRGFTKAQVWEYIVDDSKIHITDDTQMTMFGLEAMLLGGESHVIQSYADWHSTQHVSRRPTTQLGDRLIDDPLMWQCRAPGNTCMRSIANLRVQSTVNNQSNGCGTVMKALPFVFEDSPDLLVRVSKLTHQGHQIEPTAIKQWEVCQKLINKTMPNMYKGFDLDQVYDDGGWMAESCLNIAIWAFENCNGDFERLLQLAITHDGDSDSVAATAGALYGLYYETYPQQLYDRIYEKSAIDGLLNRMNTCLV